MNNFEILKQKYGIKGFDTFKSHLYKDSVNSRTLTTTLDPQTIEPLKIKLSAEMIAEMRIIDGGPNHEFKLGEQFGVAGDYDPYGQSQVSDINIDTVVRSRKVIEANLQIDDWENEDFSRNGINAQVSKRVSATESLQRGLNKIAFVGSQDGKENYGFLTEPRVTAPGSFETTPWDSNPSYDNIMDTLRSAIESAIEQSEEFASGAILDFYFPLRYQNLLSLTESTYNRTPLEALKKLTNVGKIVFLGEYAKGVFGNTSSIMDIVVNTGMASEQAWDFPVVNRLKAHAIEQNSGYMTQKLTAATYGVFLRHPELVKRTELD